MRKFTPIAAALLSLSFGNAFAAKDDIALLELERVALEKAVEVYYPSKQLADKAAITFHNQLLETNREAGFMVMELNDEDKSKLKSFGFSFKSADDYVAKRSKQITKLQQKLAERAKNPQATDGEVIDGFPCYSTVEGTFNQVGQLANAYPGLTEWVDIGNSWTKDNATDGLLSSGFDIKVLQLTNKQTTGDKPILFIHSAMHAREYATAELTLRFAQQLLTSYGTDADSTWILDNHQVHILFHLNPDGRKKAETGLLWRKNTNLNHCASSPQSIGTDLNRNFSMFWHSTANGSSGNACSETYRGPTAASEPETQAIEAYVRSIFEDKRGPNENDAAPLDTTGIHIDVHSYSELVLWPWGHTGTPAPNGTQLQTLGRKLAYFTGYTPQQSIGLYATDGTSDDVSYGELGVAAYTFELGTWFFQDCAEFDNKILPDNLKSLMYAAKVVGAPYITPAGPDVASITLNGNANAQIDAGTDVQLQVSIDDSRYQNGNGAEPQQNIVEAEYYFNQMPGSDGASAIAMSDVDGTLDSANESFEATISTEGLADGKYLIAVRGKDADGNWGAVSAGFIMVGEQVTVNNPPSASFTQACNGMECSFDASASNDIDGTIANYHWSFSDGTDVAGPDVSSVQHAFAAHGEYEVSLTVTDDLGASTTTFSTVTLENLAPVADFSINCTDNSCQFDGASSTDADGTIASYSWAFGDGHTDEGATISHTFAAAGSYGVDLTVKDEFGASATKVSSVTVTMPTTPEPTPEPTPNTSSSSGGGGSFGFAGLMLLLGGLIRKKRLL